MALNQHYTVWDKQENTLIGTSNPLVVGSIPTWDANKIRLSESFSRKAFLFGSQ